MKLVRCIIKLKLFGTRIVSTLKVKKFRFGNGASVLFASVPPAFDFTSAYCLLLTVYCLLLTLCLPLHMVMHLSITTSATVNSDNGAIMLIFEAIIHSHTKRNYHNNTTTSRTFMTSHYKPRCLYLLCKFV